MSIINAIAFFGVAFFMGTQVLSISPFFGFFLIGIIFGFLNTFVRPFVSLLALPFFFLTLGLFFIVINVAFLLIIDLIFSEFFPDVIDFYIATDWVSLVLISLVLSFFNFVLHTVFD